VVEKKPSSDVAFTAAVKAMQSRRGSREAYAKMEARGGFRTKITPDLVAFLTEIDTAYLATANAAGHAYTQHRGGPKGFIRALDETTLGFADYAGNRQYITFGNLAENDQAFLFLMDYANRRRIKIWGRARAVEDDPELISRLTSQGYAARADQAVLFELGRELPAPHSAVVMNPRIVLRGNVCRRMQIKVEGVKGEPVTKKGLRNGHRCGSAQAGPRGIDQRSKASAGGHSRPPRQLRS
jgi:predicted pyridoxine 5'-phosphate oxidase superfamily flavin-nucleotide-binding protein